MAIPLVDLKAQYQSIKHEVLPAIERVLEGMSLYLGPEQLAFEQEFAAYCRSLEGISVSNGTDALALALRACEIGDGDEVITVANTFIATVEAISIVGARPVFVDVDPSDYTMDWQAYCPCHYTPDAGDLTGTSVWPPRAYGSHSRDCSPVRTAGD